MNVKRIFNLIIYILLSIAGGIILIVISELIKFSHTNLIPFGGNSWAVWFHPIFMGLSFGVFSKLFKIKRPILIFFIITILSIIIFYFVYNGLLFVNPIPFEINVNPIL